MSLASYMVTGDKRGKTCNSQQLTTFPGLLLVTFGENRLIVAFVIFSNQYCWNEPFLLYSRSTAAREKLFSKEIDSKTHFHVKSAGPDSAKLKTARMSLLPSTSQKRTAIAVKIHPNTITVKKNRVPNKVYCKQFLQ